MTEEKMTQEIIDLANKWYDGDIQEEEFKKQAENLVKIDRYEQLMLGGVVQAKPEKVCFRCGKPVKKKGTPCYDCSLIDK